MNLDLHTERGWTQLQRNIFWK